MRFRVIILTLGLFLASWQSLLGATEGLSIDPAIQRVYLNTLGEPEEPVQKIILKNTTNLELNFTLRAIEFTEIDKNGGNIFLGQSLSEGEFKSAPWVKLPEEQILLIPGEQKEVVFELKETEKLLPGAHYAAILFETTRPAEREGEDPSRIFLRQIAASLLYISKASDQEQKIMAVKSERYTSFPKLIESLVVTFVNQGNNLAEPRGYVAVSNLFGAEVGRGILNESGKILFPGQERQIEAKFEKINYFFPGPYTFQVFYRIGDGEYEKMSVTYWYWESTAVFLGILGLMLIVVLAYRRSLRSKMAKKAD